MYLSQTNISILFFKKKQTDLYFQLDYLRKSQNFSLEYEMAVFTESLSCVEPDLIIMTCALDL